MAFGAGPHACPAKDPAFVIAVTAVETLLNRLPDIEVRMPFKDLSWVPAPWSRSLVALPVRFTPRIVVPTAAQKAESPVAASAGQVTATPRPSMGGAPKPKTGLFSRFLAWTRGE